MPLKGGGHPGFQEKVGRGLVCAAGRREGETILKLSCLWFDSDVSLNGFLRIPGNEGWRNKVVRVSGVKKEGRPRDIYAVLVGVGQYINHYQGIKRAPNAQLVFSPHLGFSLGALSVVASNRNGTGIAPGVEILINYGLEYDLTIGEDLHAEPQAKAMRGVLDLMFEQQKNEASGTPGTAEVAELGKADLKEPSLPANQGDEQNKPTPPEEEGAPKEAPEKKRKKAGVEKTPKADEPRKVEVSGVDNPEVQSSAEVKSEGSDEVVLATLTSPVGRILLCQGKIKFDLQAPGNKKLPPGTCLVGWTNGEVKKADGPGDVPFSLAPNSRVYSRALKKVLTVSKLVKDHFNQATGIWKHKSFAAPGVVPKQLVADKDRTFICAERSIFTQVLGAAKIATSFEIIYSMKYDENKKELHYCCEKRE